MQVCKWKCIFRFSPYSTTRGEGENVYTLIMEQLDDSFSPQVNVPHERHLFIKRLRQRAVYCDFGDKTNAQIQDQVIEKFISHHLRRKHLEKGKNVPLDQLRSIFWAREASERQAGAIESSHVKTDTKTEVHRVQHQNNRRPNRQKRKAGDSQAVSKKCLDVTRQGTCRMSNGAR